jgi:hypothetical protein
MATRTERALVCRAEAPVKAFCQGHAILYRETSVWQVYRGILRFLYHVGAPLGQAGTLHQSSNQGAEIEPGTRR